MPARHTSSNDAEPIAVGKAPKRQARGRRCEHPDCETVLSTYNPDTYCSVHLESEAEPEPEPELAPVMVSSAAADAPEPDPPEPERESAIFDPTYRAAPGEVERAVLHILERSPIALRRREIIERVGVGASAYSVNDVLARLTATGRITKHGATSATCYLLNRDAEPSEQPPAALAVVNEEDAGHADDRVAGSDFVTTSEDEEPEPLPHPSWEQRWGSDSPHPADLLTHGIDDYLTALQAKFVEAPNFEREKWYAERIERVLGDLAASFRHRQERAAA